MAMGSVKRSLASSVLFVCVGGLVAIVAGLVVFNIMSTLAPPGNPVRAAFGMAGGPSPAGKEAKGQ